MIERKKDAHCPKCAGSSVVKNGVVHGVQRYLCRDCRSTFTTSSPRDWTAAEKFFAVTLYVHGMTLEEVAAVNKASVQTVSRWVGEMKSIFGKDEEPADWIIEAFTEYAETHFRIVAKKKRDEVTQEELEALVFKEIMFMNERIKHREQNKLGAERFE